MEKTIHLTSKMKEINNDIKQLVQSKFSDFEAPLPQDGWLQIENSLKKTERAAAIRRRFWYSGVAAAIAALIAGSFFLLRQPALEKNVAGLPTPPSSIATPSTGKEQPEASPEKDQPILPDNNQSAPARPQAVAHKTARLQKNVADNPQIEERTTTAAPTETKIIEKEPLFAEKEKNESQKESRQQKSASLQEPDEAEQKRLIDEFINSGKQNDIFAQADVKIMKPRKKSELTFNGKGGMSSYRVAANAPMTLRSMNAQSDKPSETQNGQLPPDQANYEGLKNNHVLADVTSNASEKLHSQPLSFGVTISRNLNDRFSIETGLVYTYLYSQTKNTAQSANNESSQHLHYLGIPVNANYVFASFGKLDFYGTAGATIEKEIYGKMNYFQQSQNDVLGGSSKEQLSKKIKQKNPQISVNTGVGISYPLTGNLRLYGKIGGAYYFDAKNEYTTIYSDKKILLDMNVGLRVEF